MCRQILSLLIAAFAMFTADSALAQTRSTRHRAVRHLPAAVAAPVAVADSYALDGNSELTIAAPGVLANDTLNGAAIASYGPSTGNEQATIGSSVATNHGSLSLLATGGFTYTPQTGFTGEDTFVYVLKVGGVSASAVVTISVRAAQASAVGDSYSTPIDTDLNVPAPGVLTNDTLAGGGILSYGPRTGMELTVGGGPITTASGGRVTLNADGSFSYNTPPAVDDGYGYSRSFRGVDAFAYVIRSGTAPSAATVNILVDDSQSNADYVVTTPGHYYAISGLTGENPVLTLQRGRTYTFQISASPAHPFAILDAPAGNVTNNNITSGLLTFTVPATAQTYRYRCTTHGFGNVINTVP